MYLIMKYYIIVRHTNSKILLNSGCVIFEYHSDDLSQRLFKNCAIELLCVYDNLKCDNSRDPNGMEILCQVLFIAVIKVQSLINDASCSVLEKLDNLRSFSEMYFCNSCLLHLELHRYIWADTF